MSVAVYSFIKYVDDVKNPDNCTIPFIHFHLHCYIQYAALKTVKVKFLELAVTIRPTLDCSERLMSVVVLLSGGSSLYWDHQADILLLQCFGYRPRTPPEGSTLTPGIAGLLPALCSSPPAA